MTLVSLPSVRIEAHCHRRYREMQDLDLRIYLKRNSPPPQKPQRRSSRAAHTIDIVIKYDTPVPASTVKLWLLELDSPITLWEG